MRTDSHCARPQSLQWFGRMHRALECGVLARGKARGFHVKHPENLNAFLREGLATLGIQLSPSREEQLLAYLASVLRWNADLNLTRIVEPREAVRLHLIDSLTALPEVNAGPVGDVLDIGTGGGFPGVPLAMASGRRTTLLDSVAKKAAATQRALDETGFHGARTLAVRAEDLAQTEPGRFSVVVARAVAPLPALLELAVPLLCAGGRLVALKGDPLPQELDAGRVVAEMLGMSLVEARRVVLPSGGESRTILAYVKTGESRVRLPRRVGMAQKRPLA